VNEHSFIFATNLMRSKDEHKERMIRNKAMEMIVKEGFDGMSMQKLAKAANVSPATIYIYFKNREDLLNHLYNEVQNTFSEVALKGFSPDLSFEDGLWLQWQNRLRFIKEFPYQYQFYEQFRNSPLINHSDVQLIMDFKTNMNQFLMNAFKNGEIKKMEPEVFWSLAYGPFYSLIKFHLQEKNMMGRHFKLSPAILKTVFKQVIKSLQKKINMSTPSTKAKPIFTSYEKFVIAIIAIIQFSVVLDFMVLSPLSAILLEEMKISTAEFGWVVSAYAFSAGISGILAAGFADKFDRKKLMLFFYIGFVFGTFLCAIAPTYQFLMMARIVTGIFGGVISAISFAIISDIFKVEHRGRVMGYVQMAFAASQILGLPIGLTLANKFGWHSPFWMIAFFSLVVGVIILIYLKPVTEHLKIKSEVHPFQHLWNTVSNSNYMKGFLATVFLATGGYMLMPLGAAFSTRNLHISKELLPVLYGVTGVFSIAFGPLIGKMSDKLGRFKVFLFGTVLSGIMVAIYTQLGPTELWLVILINVILFLGINSRIISSSALMTALPEQKDRGAFMSINASIQQLSGGIAAGIAGLIVFKPELETAPLQRYDILGYVVLVSMAIAAVMIFRLDKEIKKKFEAAKAVKS
jgi:predicted MFS family arabinose efflux permease/AcrR family transcriptional regulator